MPVPDIDFTDWDTNPANCVPTDGTLIAGNLAGQIRNIKALARRYFLDKEWERWDYPPSFVDANSFDLEGDHTAVAVPQRPVRVTQSSDYFYGWITASVFSAGATQVDVYMVTGPLNAEMSEVAYGVGMSAGALLNTPYAGSSGSVTITNSDTAAVVLSPVEPDGFYHVDATVVGDTGGAAARSHLVRKINAKTASGFTILLEAATGAAKSVEVAWRITRTIAE